ncbi:tripartite tricarboxylate transporter substrate binding protein [Halomonas janggokensis]|jgi:tripartite-type tricarboxylate transporter receptor subunit TctC|uniref:Tripartite tricarboxylate transporter substrate binding protein n=1 Tax=Vreelandella janggokensis TaxID=370767 RepID=A0ABT4IWH7_9GAMM|nr:tripartite tricarboxylate transporter substrate binding protein [Halomonas janggokensis]MCZ0927334.1 tripartite tricarboxylate transporter substrate binding protein [Halomonas janggokensis]MCZ0929842.1 tripartite tricarboxylate transporter substrate binding protein [Halomonas janggokensis]
MQIRSAYAATLLSALMFSGAAQADYSAADEIKVLQGFKAGGGSDALAQLTQPFLRESLGVEFINEYLPGATGAIAWTRLAHQSPNDGSVISITNTPMLMTNYIMNDAINYSIEELTPIANVVTDPGIIVVPEDSPYETVEEFLAAAEERPGEITVGNSGVGGDDFFSTIMIEKATGLSFQKVPFQGDGPSATAALGGKIDASFNNLGNVYGHIESGSLRPLAIFAEERLDILPDVPTMVEMDIDVVAGSSRGYSAPAGIPDEARDELIAAFEALGENEEFQKTAQERAMNLDIQTGDDYGQMMQDMEGQFVEIWADVKDEVNQ